VTWRL